MRAVVGSIVAMRRETLREGNKALPRHRSVYPVRYVHIALHYEK